MNPSHCLKRLEQVQRDDSAIIPLCVDEAGLVLDDGSTAVRPSVGKHHSAVPGNPKLIMGIDPLVVVGQHGADQGRKCRSAPA